MRIAEEFFDRHNISVPLLRFVDNGVLLLKEKSGAPNWRMILISPLATRSGPPMIRIQTMRPMRSTLNRVHFEPINRHDLEWDHYEDYFLEFVKNPPNSMKIVKDNTEIVLTLWEIFIYCHDAYLISHAANPALCTSLATDLPLPERQLAYTEFSNYLHKKEPALFDVWRKEILHYVRNYCHWLSKWYVEQ